VEVSFSNIIRCYNCMPLFVCCQKVATRSIIKSWLLDSGRSHINVWLEVGRKNRKVNKGWKNIVGMDLSVLLSRTGIMALLDYKTDLEKKVSAVSIPSTMTTLFSGQCNFKPFRRGVVIEPSWFQQGYVSAAWKTDSRRLFVLTRAGLNRETSIQSGSRVIAI
jgi:hypothetical protein